ncbi:MAG: hypothetical protein PUB52_10295 [Lachnospiraceae bacterium]|nr:hypothetical protein [Lachnospiraceae bacterium]
MRNIRLAVSGVALWLLMMPANLYGLLGILLVFGVFLAKGDRIIPERGDVIRRLRWYHFLLMLLLYYVLLNNFYQRWVISGIVARIAAVIGCKTGILLVVVELLLAVLAIYAMCLAMGTLLTHCGNREESVTAACGRTQPNMKMADVFFLLGITLCMAFLLALQPWSNVYPGSDSTVFLYIGRRMSRGGVPYRDLFDHKGIVLYFLEYIGACITPDSFTGVWLVEICNLFLTALGIFCVAGLFTERRGVKYTVSMLVLATFDCYLAYEGGNLAEEYALPWLMFSLYIFLRYFITKSYKIYDIMLLGIGFGIVLFLRVNMVTVWVAFLPIIFFSMLWNRQWKEIGKCIVGFLAGCAIIVVPILLYCIKAGCLEDMLQYYIQFNFGYSESEGSMMANLGAAWFLTKLSFVFIGTIVVSTMRHWKNRIFLLNLWYFVVTIVLASMSGRNYHHYGIILMPTLVVPLAMLLRDLPEGIFRNSGKVLLGIVWSTLVLQIGTSIAGYQKQELSEMARYFQEKTTAEDNVLIIGNACRGYLEGGRETTNRFFYQTPPINISDELYQEFVAELEKERPDTVVVVGTKENLLAQDNNLASACRLFEKYVEKGVYCTEEKDTFFAYKLQE